MHNEHIKINTVQSQQVESKSNCAASLLLWLSWGHSLAYYLGVEISKIFWKKVIHRLVEGKIEANCSWKYKTWRWGKKNHVLMVPVWIQTSHQPSYMKSVQAILSHLSKAVEMEWTRFISATSEKCKMISGMVLSDMVISRRLNLQTLSPEGHVKQWLLSD